MSLCREQVSYLLKGFLFGKKAETNTEMSMHFINTFFKACKAGEREESGILKS